jgi:hypothetical protein
VGIAQQHLIRAETLLIRELSVIKNAAKLFQIVLIVKWLVASALNAKNHFLMKIAKAHVITVQKAPAI